MYIACSAFVRGGVEVGWGRGYFPAGRPRSKIPSPLGSLSEKILNFLGAVCARMCGGGRERERERHKIGIPQP